MAPTDGLALAATAGSAVSRDTADGAQIDAPKGAKLVLTATPTPAVMNPAPTSVTWTHAGAAPAAPGGTAGTTQTAWTYEVASVDDATAGDWTATVGGHAASVKVAVVPAGAAAPAEPETPPPTVVEVAPGEYDGKVATVAVVICGLTGLLLLVVAVVALFRATTSQDGKLVAVQGFVVVALVALSLCAALALAAIWAGVMETRGRLHDARGRRRNRGGLDVDEAAADLGKEFVKQLVVMRATVALLAVVAAVGMTAVIASCQVATSAVSPSPSPSASETATSTPSGSVTATATATPTPSGSASS